MAFIVLPQQLPIINFRINCPILQYLQKIQVHVHVCVGAMYGRHAFLLLYLHYPRVCYFSPMHRYSDLAPGLLLIEVFIMKTCSSEFIFF